MIPSVGRDGDRRRAGKPCQSPPQIIARTHSQERHFSELCGGTLPRPGSRPPLPGSTTSGVPPIVYMIGDRFRHTHRHASAPARQCGDVAPRNRSGRVSRGCDQGSERRTLEPHRVAGVTRSAGPVGTAGRAESGPCREGAPPRAPRHFFGQSTGARREKCWSPHSSRRQGTNNVALLIPAGRVAHAAPALSVPICVFYPGRAGPRRAAHRGVTGAGPGGATGAPQAQDAIFSRV
jgi:hypothetical protein